MNNILKEKEFEAKSRLKSLDITLEQIPTIAKQAIGERYRAVANHPKNAPGQFAYLEGVKSMRDLLVDGTKWHKLSENNLELIENRDKKIRLAYQNVDYACNKFNDPQPLSKKGSASARAVSSNQLALFGEDDESAKSSTWFICVSEKDGVINAELCLPKSISSGLFDGFHERIFCLVNWGQEISQDNTSNQMENAYNDDILISKKE